MATIIDVPVPEQPVDEPARRAPRQPRKRKSRAVDHPAIALTYNSAPEEKPEQSAPQQVEVDPEFKAKVDNAKRMLYIHFTSGEKDLEKRQACIKEVNSMSDARVLELAEALSIKNNMDQITHVAGIACLGVGTILDKIFSAEGCILKNFAGDDALREAVAQELTDASQSYIGYFFNNKVKIAIAAGKNVVEGFKAKKQKTKPEESQPVPQPGEDPFKDHPLPLREK
jgi:hypothetical protein